MERRSTLLLCTCMLSIGFAAGAAWTQGTPLQARAVTVEESSRLYDELGAARGSLIEGSDLLAKIARVTTPSVVHIQSERRAPGRGRIEETGSGVITTSSRAPGTYIVTNRHVVANAELSDVSISLSDGRVLHPEQVWTDPATDVAVLKVNARDLLPARWGDSDQVQIGHMVLAMGSPFGLSQSMTFGIVSAKGRRSLKLGATHDVINQDFLQTDAAINPGNSGGPLINLQGQVIAINTAIASNSGGNDGIGFSIPSNLVRRIVDQLLEHGRVQRAYLGVRLDSKFDAQAAARYKLDRRRGARVDLVFPNTPASQADLRVDDVILRFGDIDVLDENHLINLVSLTPVGRRVKMEILRDGQPRTLDVLLADRTELEQRSENGR